MSQSHDYAQQAKQLMPGGVNSPVRAFGSVNDDPIFFEAAQGAYLTDVDGKRYLDYVGGFGPMLLGHAHPDVLEAIQTGVQQGLCFGASNPLEVTLAQKICDLMPHINMLRMVNSGTEATLSVLRLARGYTKRNKIVKFAGCYHGHHDALLVQSGSGTLTFGTPTSAGIAPSVVQDTLVAEYNNLEQVTELFQHTGNEIAAIIVEPVAGNMGCVLPEPGFLQGLRTLCDEYGSLLIFDEVITGFRIARGGAQAVYGVTPDLTTLGKIIGGGLPIGAFGGNKHIMMHLSPMGDVYQAGTLSGNPVTMAAGLATLAALSQPDFYTRLFDYTQTLVDAMQDCAKQANVPVVINQIGALFSLFFTDQPSVTNLTQVSACDFDYFQAYFHHMLAQSIYLAPSGYECSFVSSAHGQAELDLTCHAMSRAFKAIA